MCHDPHAVPPTFGEPRTAVADSGPAVLTSADGTRIAAHLAVPAETLGPAVLVLPDNRGLSGFYENLCDRLAERGHPALAVDYFGRTAGHDHQARAADFPFMEHLFKLTRDGLYADMAAGIARLRELSSVSDGPVFTVGFCFGGRQAFLSASGRFGLAGAVGFYGHPGELFGAPGPTQLAADFTAPVLGLFGGADEGIPAEVVEAFDAALASAGVGHELVVYPGMPHGFFELGAGGVAGAGGVGGTGGDPAVCMDAWNRVLAFLDRQAAVRGHDTPETPHSAR